MGSGVAVGGTGVMVILWLYTCPLSPTTFRLKVVGTVGHSSELPVNVLAVPGTLLVPLLALEYSTLWAYCTFHESVTHSPGLVVV